MTERLERTSLKLGFVPLADAAPLVVAKARGFFAEAGLEVELERVMSWAGLRDKVMVGALDGAHMLGPLPLAMTAGSGPVSVPMVVGMALNRGGNTLTLSEPLFSRLHAIDPDQADTIPLSAALMRAVIDQGGAPLSLATVFPSSSHTYDLRAWLCSGGIDPDRHVRLVVVSPPRMVSALMEGRIDGFCAGEPWGTLAAGRCAGRVVATSLDLSGGRFEKVFAVTKAWADANPKAHLAVLAALIKAARWCEENRAETAEIMAGPTILNAPLDIVRASFLGQGGLPPDLLRFHQSGTNIPEIAQACWFVQRMIDAGHVPPATDGPALAAQVFRTDLYEQAAGAAGYA